jgi:hypothetical protein
MPMSINSIIANRPKKKMVIPGPNIPFDGIAFSFLFVIN